MYPDDTSFENDQANTNMYQFKMSIAQADGAEAAIFYNTSGYTRGFFDLRLHSSHGSIGWCHVMGQISRYGLNYTVESENMAYQNLAYVQKSGAANFNGIKLVRTGTFGTSTTSIHGHFYSPAGAGISLYQSLSGTNTLNSSAILSKGV